MARLSRRAFIKTSVHTAGCLTLPSLVPATVLGQNAPSAKINVGIIGTGRQSFHVNMPQFLNLPDVRIVAVCDVDQWRLNNAKQKVDTFYGNSACQTYTDYHEVIARKDVDAVMISTADHWHVFMSLDAIRAGKHVSCEKPLTLSIQEGRILADTAKRYGIVFRTDSECRSAAHMRRSVEYVLNGRIGELQRIKSGAPAGDVAGGDPTPTPIPLELDYERWTGPALKRPYCVDRVHASKQYNRPGWMRCRETCEGMITNWGTHLNDIVQWANGTERTGPVEVEATGTYPDKGLWAVLLDFNVKYKYANGVELAYHIDKPYVRFEGTDGWVHAIWLGEGQGLTASSPDILNDPLSPGDIHLPRRQDKEDFIYAIKHGTNTMADAEVGHRTTSLCQLGHIAVQVGGKLTWDPKAETFANSDSANRLLSRPYRNPWTL